MILNNPNIENKTWYFVIRGGKSRHPTKNVKLAARAGSESTAAWAEGECCMWYELKARAPTSQPSASIAFSVHVSHITLLHSTLLHFTPLLNYEMSLWKVLFFNACTKCPSFGGLWSVAKVALSSKACELKYCGCVHRPSRIYDTLPKQHRNIKKIL